MAPFRLRLIPREERFCEDFASFADQLCTGAALLEEMRGVGATRRMSAVRWGVAAQIGSAWILAMPASAAIGAIGDAGLAAFGGSPAR